MSVRRVAMLSVHTSPLAQPGTGDGGGMNVYVRSLASALARAGVECDVITRAEHAEQPRDRRRRTRVPRRPRRRRSACPGRQGRARGAGRRPGRRDAPPRPRDRRRVRRVARQLLGLGCRRHTRSSTTSISRWSRRSTRSPTSRPRPASTTTPPDRYRFENEVVRCADRLVASTVEERDQLASLLRRGSRAGRDHPAGRRPRGVLARRPDGRPAPRSASPTGRRCCSSVASSR